MHLFFLKYCLKQLQKNNSEYVRLNKEVTQQYLKDT